MAMLALFGAGFWLLVLRPAKAKQAQQQQLLSSVKVGDKIMTTAGLFGQVTELSDDEVGIEVAPGVGVRMVRAAIARIVPPIDATSASDEVEAAGDGSANATVDVTEALAGSQGNTVPGSGPSAAN